MGKKKEKSLPPLPAYAQSKLEHLAKEVRSLWGSMDYGQTRKAIKIGHKLLAGEKEVFQIYGQKRNVWSHFRAHYFPEIESARMAERYMFLARHIALESPKIFFCLSQDSLTELIRLAGSQGIKKFLVANKVTIDWKMDPTQKENKPEMANFKKAVLSRIASLKNEEKETKTIQGEAKKSAKEPDPVKPQTINEAIKSMQMSFDQFEQLLISITSRKDFKGKKKSRFQAKLINYVENLNSYLGRAPEKYKGPVKLHPAMGRKKGKEPKNRPFRPRDN